MAHYRRMVGERVYLSPMSIEDAPQYTEWLNDAEVTQYLNAATMIISKSGEEDWLKANSGKHNFGIVLMDGDRLIGNVGLQEPDSLNATGEIGIFIGAKDCWDKGYGTEAMALLMGYGFEILNLDSIRLCVFPWNPRARASYEKLGFRPAGRLRKAIRRWGRSWDEILMDITADEFRAGPYARFAPTPPENSSPA